MKKLVLFVVLVMIVASGVFAQKNWISGEVGLIGAGVRYEFMLNDKLSIGGNAYWNSFFFFWNEMGISASARYYLFGNLFVGAGVGFNMHTGTYKESSNGYEYSWFAKITGGAITAEVGWKIDVGQPGKFFIQPGLKIPVTFGMREPYWTGDDKKFAIGFGVVPYFGMGFAF